MTGHDVAFPPWIPIETIGALELGGEPELRRLGKGRTNESWELRNPTSGRAYFVQRMLPADKAHALGIDRNVHARVLALVADREFAICPVVADFDVGVVISEFLSGAPFPPPGTPRSEEVKAAALAMRGLHSIVVPDPDRLRAPLAEIFTGVEGLVREVCRVRPDVAKKQSRLIEAIRRLRNIRGPYRECLVHGDLSADNILIVAGSMYFIDWEYSGMGDPYADLGSFAERCELDDHEAAVLLHAYFDQISEDSIYLLALYRTALAISEGFWGCLAQYASTSGADMNDYTDQWFDRAHHLLDGFAALAAADGRIDL